jgi:AcrR family transcriptional regulator
MAPEAPLTREQIVATAEEVIRRFGPSKATVVDVARALGVSHAAVYRHVATKAELRDLVLERWVDSTMAPLRAIAAETDSPPERLRRFVDTLVATKRRRYADDPELFSAYRALSADASKPATSHQHQLISLLARIVADGVADGSFRAVDPQAAGQAVLTSTLRFHHPLHADEWSNPGIDAAYDQVWEVLMRGLRA